MTDVTTETTLADAPAQTDVEPGTGSIRSELRITRMEATFGPEGPSMFTVSTDDEDEEDPIIRVNNDEIAESFTPAAFTGVLLNELMPLGNVEIEECVFSFEAENGGTFRVRVTDTQGFQNAVDALVANAEHFALGAADIDIDEAITVLMNRADMLDFNADLRIASGHVVIESAATIGGDDYYIGDLLFHDNQATRIMRVNVEGTNTDGKGHKTRTKRLDMTMFEALQWLADEIQDREGRVSIALNPAATVMGLDSYSIVTMIGGRERIFTDIKRLVVDFKKEAGKLYDARTVEPIDLMQRLITRCQAAIEAMQATKVGMFVAPDEDKAVAVVAKNQPKAEPAKSGGKSEGKAEPKPKGKGRSSSKPAEAPAPEAPAAEQPEQTAAVEDEPQPRVSSARRRQGGDTAPATGKPIAAALEKAVAKRDAKEGAAK